jgi:multidrug resistance efflux pump
MLCLRVRKGHTIIQKNLKCRRMRSLMSYGQIVRGHVDSIVCAINVSNAQPNNQGVATVSPIFAWVRLAQRIPVRVRIDEVPSWVVLAAGMTATVENDDRTRGRIGALHFSELGSLLTH